MNGCISSLLIHCSFSGENTLPMTDLYYFLIKYRKVIIYKQ